jgi:hypothetical protein
MLIINGKLPALPRDSRSLAVPGILVRLGLEFASFPLTPPSPPGEGEFSHGSEEFERCSCSPRFFGFRSEAHDNKARPYYQSTAECFSLSLRERAGVRGNSATAVLVASALKSAPETARAGCTALIHSSFQASGLPEVVDLERQFSVGSLKVKFLDRNENDVTGLKLGIFGRIGGVK